ncbi:MAG: sporulation protein YtfJ [Clostridiales bacterium]|nr:sporulation protein YtfJ [Clostridiales bacterium]
MADKNDVQGLLGVSMEKIKQMVDVNTIIGDPITALPGTVLIPVSKVSYGFAAGGSDWPSKQNTALFGGGSGAGINITPIAFIVIREDDVRLLHVVAKPDSGDKIANLVPELVDKIASLFPSRKVKSEETRVEAPDGSVTVKKAEVTGESEEG